jgi:hypothetical protein
MSRRLPYRSSAVLTVTCLAAFLVLGGTGGAAVSQAPPNNSVGTSQLKNDAVTSPKIKGGAVQSSEIKDGAVAANDLHNDSVTNAKIGKNAVTATEVKDHSLLAVDFAVGQLPRGPQGPPGPAGPAGPGVGGLERRADQTQTDSTNSKSTTATCPSGKRVLGGGARVTGDAAAQVTISESFPDSSLDRWNAVARESDPTDATWQLSVYALCATFGS